MFEVQMGSLSDNALWLVMGILLVVVAYGVGLAIYRAAKMFMGIHEYYQSSLDKAKQDQHNNTARTVTIDAAIQELQKFKDEVRPRLQDIDPTIKEAVASLLTWKEGHQKQCESEHTRIENKIDNLQREGAEGRANIYRVIEKLDTDFKSDIERIDGKIDRIIDMLLHDKKTL